MTAAFTRRRIEAMEPRIREIAAGLLDELHGADGPVDLVTAYSYPLPITVICELIGIPAVRRETFRRWPRSRTSPARGSTSPGGGSRQTR